MSPEQLLQCQVAECEQLAAVWAAEDAALVELGLTTSAHKTMATMLQGREGVGYRAGNDTHGVGNDMHGVGNDLYGENSSGVLQGGMPSDGGAAIMPLVRASWHSGAVGSRGSGVGGQGAAGEVLGEEEADVHHTRGVLGLSWDPAVAAGLLGDAVMGGEARKHQGGNGGGGVYSSSTSLRDKEIKRDVYQAHTTRPTALMPPVANMWGLR